MSAPLAHCHLLMGNIRANSTGIYQQVVYPANLIAENLYSQVDREGHHFSMIKEIIDYKVDDSAISKDQSQFLCDKDGQPAGMEPWGLTSEPKQ